MSKTRSISFFFAKADSAVVALCVATVEPATGAPAQSGEGATPPPSPTTNGNPWHG
ncbi:hypothetical protein [Goodfellowiella coeruleoviolacea]|uniref:Uncharacterized protein n=1 Tax=Goodfellowiella coeruleoviolacea TaxID=334858 RepID=A0AAE3GH97_9PSEU|nr:hypothetical protein [Goodfellowiella coeruleoviolacea]MCP2167249.1 hypothetical protein [Goodfellowiella coeruleoviolacea]